MQSGSKQWPRFTVAKDWNRHRKNDFHDERNDIAAFCFARSEFAFHTQPVVFRTQTVAFHAQTVAFHTRTVSFHTQISFFMLKSRFSCSNATFHTGGWGGEMKYKSSALSVSCAAMLHPTDNNIRSYWHQQRYANLRPDECGINAQYNRLDMDE